MPTNDDTADQPAQELKPASQNPWYVLATVHGEQTDDVVDLELHAKNRRIWNGWACGHLPKEERERLAEECGVDAAEVQPWSDLERRKVSKEFCERLASDDAVPKSEEYIDFGNTRFQYTVCMSSLVFCGNVFFEEADLGGRASFTSAIFGGVASFKKARFHMSAEFYGTIFYNVAEFNYAHFFVEARFDQARFRGEDWFGSNFGRRPMLRTSTPRQAANLSPSSARPSQSRVRQRTSATSSGARWHFVQRLAASGRGCRISSIGICRNSGIRLSGR